MVGLEACEEVVDIVEVALLDVNPMCGGGGKAGGLESVRDVGGFGISN